jgi:peptidoglycan/xylan/chitin deacetylase (PgdA/CDA1 family)
MRRVAAVFMLVAAMALGLSEAPVRRQAAASVPKLPVIMYHHVGNWGVSRADWAPWVVRPEDFAAQLDWLRAHGYRTVTFEQFAAETAGGRRPAGKPVVISFDDGWAAQGGVVKTFLEPRGMKAVLFVFTGAVGPTRNGGGYISWEELHELEAAGHEVQSHTVSHGRLTQMLPPQLEREMRESKATIERETKHPCRVVAYPYGDHDRAVMLAAQRSPCTREGWVKLSSVACTSGPRRASMAALSTANSAAVMASRPPGMGTRIMCASGMPRARW